jgi:hypothetical protein
MSNEGTPLADPMDNCTWLSRGAKRREELEARGSLYSIMRGLKELQLM